MPTTIALAGKGGVGKTSISGLVIKYLVENQPGAILGIDADPSSNLNMVLGLDLEWTVGDIREDMLNQVKKTLTAGGAAMGSLPGGMSKHDYLNYEIQSALSEGNRFDLIAMGQGEGPGCYCAVNHNLREVVDGISKNYRFVIIDNEAGLEHLSRRTTRDVDHLLIVSDSSQRGLVAAKRVADIGRTISTNIENFHLILNRMDCEKVPQWQDKIDGVGIPYLGCIPADETLNDFEFDGRALVELPNDTPAYLAISSMMEKILK